MHIIFILEGFQRKNPTTTTGKVQFASHLSILSDSADLQLIRNSSKTAPTTTMPYQPANSGGTTGGSKAAAKMAQLKFWNKQNSSKQQQQDKDKDKDAADAGNNSSNTTGNSNGDAKAEAKNGKRNWLHTPEQLINGHAVYLVKVSGGRRAGQWPVTTSSVATWRELINFCNKMTKRLENYNDRGLWVI